MFLFRLGKEKLSYNVTVSLLKLKYQPKDNLNSDQQIQIVVNRGSHRLEFLSQINKKGQIKVDKESQNFNMTLYYDKGDKVFEKKMMTIQGKVLNEFNETVTTLQKVEMDIAQYAEESGNTENNIQAQIYKQGSKKEYCKVVFNLKIVKRDGCFTETDTYNSEQKSINKSKNKYGQKVTISRKKQTLTQNIQKSQEDATYSLKSKVKNSKKYQNTLQRKEKNKEVEERIRKGNEQTVRSHSIKKFDFEQTSEDNQTVEFNKQLPTPPRFKINQNPIQPSSLDLKLFETEKMLKQKNKQVLKLKKELEIQKKISESLLNDQRNQQNANISSQALKEMENLKTQLIVANMKLNDLETVNRKYGNQLDEAHEANHKQAQQLAYYKNMLQKEKVKMAEVFQMALERGDTDLISFLQELASQQ